MLKRLFFRVCAISLLLVPGASGADWVIKQSTYYLTAAQQEFRDFPPPPADGSKADLADMSELKAWQLKRTPEECARANAEAHAEYGEIFGGVSPFTDPMPEAAAAVFVRVRGETDGVVAAVKDRYKRQRPFLRDQSLQPCLGRVPGLAYPSGHATIARVFALMLGDLVPARRADFLARADEAALDRVIGGVHHPSDIEAGKRLADRLYRAYGRSKRFKSDMDALRALLRTPAAK